jgi:hypothetical protein
MLASQSNFVHTMVAGLVFLFVVNAGITVMQMQDKKSNGGEGGIRTPGTLSGTPVFKTGAINHSATSPRLLLEFYMRGKFALALVYMTRQGHHRRQILHGRFPA